jgi:hypothetical protein
MAAKVFIVLLVPSVILVQLVAMEDGVPTITYRFQATRDQVVSVTLTADSLVTPAELALTRHVLALHSNGSISLRGCRVLQLLPSCGSLAGLVACRLAANVTIFTPARSPSLVWNIEQNTSLLQCPFAPCSVAQNAGMCFTSGAVVAGPCLPPVSSGSAAPFDVILASFGDEPWNTVTVSELVRCLFDFCGAIFCCAPVATVPLWRCRFIWFHRRHPGCLLQLSGPLACTLLHLRTRWVSLHFWTRLAKGSLSRQLQLTPQQLCLN